VIFAVWEWLWPITTTGKGVCRFYLLTLIKFSSLHRPKNTCQVLITQTQKRGSKAIFQDGCRRHLGNQRKAVYQRSIFRFIWNLVHRLRKSCWAQTSRKQILQMAFNIAAAVCEVTRRAVRNFIAVRNQFGNIVLHMFIRTWSTQKMLNRKDRQLARWLP
jgi:hypothetical protein